MFVGKDDGVVGGQVEKSAKKLGGTLAIYHQSATALGEQVVGIEALFDNEIARGGIFAFLLCGGIVGVYVVGVTGGIGAVIVYRQTVIVGLI